MKACIFRWYALVACSTSPLVPGHLISFLEAPPGPTAPNDSSGLSQRRVERFWKPLAERPPRSMTFGWNTQRSAAPRPWPSTYEDVALGRTWGI